jgi:hypothetical protein
MVSKRLLIPIGIAAVFVAYIILPAGPGQLWLIVERSGEVPVTGVVMAVDNNGRLHTVYVANGSAYLPPGLYKVETRIMPVKYGGPSPASAIFYHVDASYNPVCTVRGYLVYNNTVWYSPPRWCTTAEANPSTYCGRLYGLVMATAPAASEYVYYGPYYWRHPRLGYLLPRAPVFIGYVSTPGEIVWEGDAYSMPEYYGGVVVYPYNGSARPWMFEAWLLCPP